MENGAAARLEPMLETLIILPVRPRHAAVVIRSGDYRQFLQGALAFFSRLTLKPPLSVPGTVRSN